MSSDQGDLRAKLNARTEEARIQEESLQKYNQIALREYPRLVNELFARTKSLLEGVQGLTITFRDFDLPLERGAGKVRVPEWTISYQNRKIIFRPVGNGYLGVNGRIDILVNGNPLPDGIVMASHQDNEQNWKLGLLIRERRVVFQELSDDVFSPFLEHLLLG